jgi:TetR/AcrR family transcriptional regulator, cholesterol catabolism regulator
VAARLGGGQPTVRKAFSAMTGPQDRRELILASAAEMFARKGIGATTVREIADAVGVLSGSLYHHFESKDAIVDEILSRYLDAIRTRYAEVLASGTSPAECLHDLVLTSLQVAEDQPHATAIYQNELHYLREQPRFQNVQAAAGDVQRTWLGVIETGVADGSFRDDIPPRVFYRLIRDAVWLSVRWHRPGGGYPTDQLAEDVTSIFLDGFSANSRGRQARTRRTARAAPRTSARNA